MVKINGVTYKGNNLLIDHKQRVYIDGIEINKCEILDKSYKKPIGFLVKLKFFFRNLLNE